MTHDGRIIASITEGAGRWVDVDEEMRRAAAFGNRALVSVRLDQGAQVDKRDHVGYTALHLAVRDGYKDIVLLLLDRGAVVDNQDINGRTALIAAAKYGNKDIVLLLLDRGAKVDNKDNYGHTALIAAAECGHKDIVLLLLDRGAGVVDNQSIDGGTALIAAAGSGHKDIVLLLLDRGAGVVDNPNINGRTALIAAADSGHKDIVLLLLDRGAKVDHKNNLGSTALIAAAKYGNKDIVLLLLDRGAKVDNKDINGRTALIAAADSGHKDIVLLLLDRGAEVDNQDNRGTTALIAAIICCHKDIVLLLLDRGAVVDSQDINGRTTALIAAAKYGNKDIVLRLLDRGAKVDDKNNLGNTALMAAAESGHKDIVLPLLDRGAEVDNQDNHGSTALIAAIICCHKEIVLLLLDRGAEVNTVAMGNNFACACQTAWMMATQRGLQDVMSLLLDRRAGGNGLVIAALAAPRKYRADLVSFLAGRGANLNAIVTGGRYPTVLIAVTHLRTVAELRPGSTDSARKSYSNIMNLLLDWGADINLAVDDEKYGTALNTAVFLRTNDKERRTRQVWKTHVVSELLNRGADPNISTGDYGTAMGIAAYNGNATYVTLLRNNGGDIHHVGGKYATAGGEYPTALDAAEAGAEARGDRDAKAIVSLRNLLCDYAIKFPSPSSKLWPPFPMPYSDTYEAPIRSHSSTAEEILSAMSTFKFTAGGALTPEQASWPCKTMDEGLLITALVALIGLETEAVQRNQVWIHNDARYIITKCYDLGLAYAACRVAWKDFNDQPFNIAAHRGRWHKEANYADALRAQLIYRDSNTGLELIKSPYLVMPRRLWDLKSNRVVEFRMLLSEFLARRSNSNPNVDTTNSAIAPAFWAITHSWRSEMKPLETAINLYQWPVPFPVQVYRDGGAGLRQELLQVGADYVWLDVLCLRQHPGSSRTGNNYSSKIRAEEWKLDVPTIGNIYRIATGLVRYFNGLGVPFSHEMWDDDRHWLRRAWTLQEIRSENTTINGGTSKPNAMPSRHSLMSTTSTLSSEKTTTLREAIRPVVQLAAEVDSSTGCSIYDLATEMAKRFATQPTDKVAGLLYLLRTTQLPTYDERISAEDAWRHCIQVLPLERKVEILCDFPYRGTHNQWFPTWSQLLEWPQRDPQYVHVRSVWRDDNLDKSHKSENPDFEISIFLPNIWVIPDVQLVFSSEPNQYHFKIEGSDSSYEFYCPYLHQEPIPVQPQTASRIALATVSLGHSNNWVVCEMQGPQRVAQKSPKGEKTMVSIEVLKKLGVLATDSCSELFIHAGSSRSKLKKISCLFT